MSKHRVFTPYNALADRLNDQRGVDVLTATAGARRAVQRLEPDAMKEIDKALASLTEDLGIFRAANPIDWPIAAQHAYAAADVLAGLAPAFGRPSLGQAANSLCKVIAEAPHERPDAAAVHIEAMILIRKDEAAGAIVMSGLLELSASVARDSASSFSKGAVN